MEICLNAHCIAVFLLLMVHYKYGKLLEKKIFKLSCNANSSRLNAFNATNHLLYLLVTAGFI